MNIIFQEQTSSFKKKSRGIICVFILLLLIGCNNQHVNKKKGAEEIKLNAVGITKPPSSYNDTLTISVTSAVFFSPDSVQLVKYKATTPSNVYETTTHENFYLFNNSKLLLQRNWKNIQVLDASKVRYLQFIKSDKSIFLVDLNSKNEIYGLYIFDIYQDPLLIDMMNFETELVRYFKQ